MFAKTAIVLCALAQVGFSALNLGCGGCNNLGYSGLGYSGCGCGGVASTGGGLPVASASPCAPVGISVLSENAYEGRLCAGGNLPFLGTVAIEGTLPTAGAGAVSYGCGNNAVGIATEGPIGTGITGPGSYPPAGPGNYGPGLGRGYGIAGIGGYGLGGCGCGCNL